MADNYDMRQPELRNWQPNSIREGLPALFGSLYANIPGIGLLDPNVERRGMDVGHRLTQALMQSPAGLGLMAHETGTKTADRLGEGEYAKALGTLLGGGAAIAAPFGIGKMFGPGSRDANIAATLEAMAPGTAIGSRVSPFSPGLRGAEDLGAGSVMRGPSREGTMQLNFPEMRRTIPQASNDGGNWYPMLVK